MRDKKPDLPPRLKQIFDDLALNIERTKAVTYAEIYDRESGTSLHGFAEGHDLKTSEYLDRMVNDMIAVQTAIGMNNPGLAIKALMGCKVEEKNYPGICGYYGNISARRIKALSEIEGLPIMPHIYFRRLKDEIAPLVKLIHPATLNP